jgi:flagellar M-ring protein FliF
MQALKLLGQQLAKIWSQLGINQKVVIVISGLAVLAGLSGLVYWSSRTEYSLLYGRLDPEEAGKMISTLDEEKISYRTGGGGHSIYVPQDKVAETRAKLAMKGLPKAEGVGFEIFDKPSFGMSDFIQQANYTRALQGELARTIAWFDGVEQARVMISKPESRLLVDPNKKTTASVALKLRGAKHIEARTVEAIRALVANSVEGLKPNNVTVTDNSGNLLSDNSDEGSLGQLSSSQLGARRNIESYLTRKVQSMLEKVVGQDQVVVGVSVEINTDTITKTDETFSPVGVLKTEKKDIETSNSVTPNPGGVPGTTVNSNTDTNSPTFQMTGNTMGRTNTLSEFAVNKSMTNMVQVAGGLKSVRASVLINTNNNPLFSTTNNVDQMWRNLHLVVYNALGIEPGNLNLLSQNTLVTVQGVGFNERQAIQLTQEMQSDRRTHMLWTTGRSVLYVLLGLAALVGFWKLVRNSTEELLPTGIPVGQLIGGQLVYESPVGQVGGMGMSMPTGAVQSIEEQKVEEAMAGDEDVEELQAAKSKLVMDFGLGQQAPERITIEVLKQLIKENPAKMSQAARIWMSRKAKEEES